MATMVGVAAGAGAGKSKGTNSYEKVAFRREFHVLTACCLLEFKF